MATPPERELNPRQLLKAMFSAAVQRAMPLDNLGRYLPAPPKGRTLVVGAGKAAASMAHAVEALWPAQSPLSGLVVTRYGHVPDRPEGLAQRIEVVQASHPVPDQAGVQAASRMLEMAREMTADDLVLFLVSGGGSSLLSLPVDGLSLQDKQSLNQQLLASGASISEMNCVRKHLSQVKGGKLGKACWPARLVTLAISDVPGDDPSIIASGPTVPDATNCADAYDVLRRYAIEVPETVRSRLRAGELETPKLGDIRLAGEVHVVAAAIQSLQAAADVARAHGLQAHILSDAMEGESREAGKLHAALARSVVDRGMPFSRPCVLLSGGETTVTVGSVPPNTVLGEGGRAGEFCLGFAQAGQDCPGVWALAADTDGIDGTGNIAGAFVTPDTLQRARLAGVSLTDAIVRHDAHGFFGSVADLLVTGPTFTNVNDFRAVLIV